MRLRLLRRRLTISAPRMSVRSAMPWTVRCVLVAVVLGFCAAISMWAFEVGKSIAGLERGSKEEVVRLNGKLKELQAQLEELKKEHDQAQLIANTAGTLVTTEQAAKEQLQQQIKQLEAQNQSLRDDLGFFEKLIPAAGSEGIAIRGLQAELQGNNSLRWQVLVIQPNKNAVEFNGHLELVFTGLQNNKPWSATLSNNKQAFKVKQYGRMEGVFEIPPQVVVKGLSAKVYDGSAVRASQTIKL